MRTALVATLVLGAPALAQTTFTVTNTNDAGAGSLRQAIIDANAQPNGSLADEIHFNIPGTGPHTISPGSPFPIVTDPVVIDGYTQPGSSANTNPFGQGLNSVLRIELNGSGAGFTSGLVITGGATTLRGLVINRFSAQAIEIGQQGGVIVEGCFLNTNVAGTAGVGGGFSAIFIDNVSQNRIGGTTPAARNLLVGRSFHGIELGGPAATVNWIQGNLIGTDVTGTTSLGATFFGINVFDGANNNLIGGTTPGAGNVISGNGSWGLALHLGSSNNLVQGNYIGTDAAGMTAIPNASDGIRIETNATGNVIGGTDPAARNVVSGNSGDGVEIQNPGSTGNRIEGNYIGTDRTGLAPLPNGASGVEFDDTSDNTVGGTAPGARNVIAFNGSAGVLILAGTGNAARANALHANGGLGVDLAPAGATANDPGDADEGANRLQNFPEITSATGDNAATLTIAFAVPSSTANSTYPLSVEFFLADADDQEGQVFLGSQTYDAAVAEQLVTRAFTPAAAITDGDRVVATATDAAGNTSEFSAPVVVVGSVATEPDHDLPSGASLSAGRPNPFDGSTTLSLQLVEAGRVIVAVYDALGRRVGVLHDGPLAAGDHPLRFDAGSLPSGVYAVRASGADFEIVRRVVLVR